MENIVKNIKCIGCDEIFEDENEQDASFAFCPKCDKKWKNLMRALDRAGIHNLNVSADFNGGSRNLHLKSS